MSRWSSVPFAGDADHFPATMGLTLFVIGATRAKSRQTQDEVAS
jgi:hypothetical protein